MRKRATQRKNKNLKPSKSRKFYFLFISILFFVLAFIGGLYYFLNNAFSQNRVIVAEQNNSQYSLSAYYIAEGNVATLRIPSNIYIEAAMQRGSWRLESVAKIISVENLDRQMYANTLMKAFDVPVDYWQMGVRTNLSLIQRLKLFMIKNKLTSTSNQTFDLVESRSLVETELPDGENGYIRQSDLNSDIKRLFIDENYVAEGYRVEIERRINKNFQSATDLVEILTTMGLHVVNIKREDADDTDCVIEAKENVTVDRLAKMFDCKTLINNEGNIDIRVKIGNKFAEKF